MKSKIINYIIGIIFLIYYCISIQNTYLQIVTYKNGWYLGEWIINYQDGGFKRRGLFGTIFIFLNEITHIPIEYFVFSFLFVIYTVFFFLLVKLFWKNSNSLMTIAILLLPSAFGMLLKDPTIAAKKDIFFMLLYLIYFMSLKSKIMIKDLVITVLIIVSILNHEVSFFYLPFVAFTYFIKNEGTTIDKLKKIFISQIIPAVLIMGILYKFGMDIKTNNSITFLKAHGLQLGQLGIYEYDPNFDILNFYKEHIYGYQTYSISLLISLIIFGIYYKFNGLKINFRFIIVQALFLIPLFFIAYDWGRWINILFSLLTIYIAGEKTLASNTKKDIVALILIAFNFSWSMMVLHQGFLTFPALDSLIKRAYYFIFYKIQKVF
ncbi:hypothetical protein N0B40_14035 [Chryseobacterium oranimense]|uniref:hypothetical protein n=1 Tax=Chryseobacterium oranimense TaxID=421058 RepID=UPI0021AFC235|nr:hypothetical protein [Chryseobacterium oranimense]UWX59526.1 hypothetical protein N0B40_14035 [Chryseobacterium oranimense]